MIKVDILDTETNDTIEIRLQFDKENFFRRFHATGKDLQIEDEKIRAIIEEAINK